MVRSIDRFEGFEAMALSERMITTSYLLSWLVADAAESTRRALSSLICREGIYRLVLLWTYKLGNLRKAKGNTSRPRKYVVKLNSVYNIGLMTLERGCPNQEISGVVCETEMRTSHLNVQCRRACRKAEFENLTLSSTQDNIAQLSTSRRTTLFGCLIMGIGYVAISAYMR